MWCCITWTDLGIDMRFLRTGNRMFPYSSSVDSSIIKKRGCNAAPITSDPRRSVSMDGSMCWYHIFCQENAKPWWKESDVRKRGQADQKKKLKFISRNSYPGTHIPQLISRNSYPGTGDFYRQVTQRESKGNWTSSCKSAKEGWQWRRSSFSLKYKDIISVMSSTSSSPTILLAKVNLWCLRQ